MKKAKDYCTNFPEYWASYKKPSKWWKVWEWFKIISIKHCCKIHDKKCSTSRFMSCLWNNNVVGAIPISLIAGLFCWLKHTKLMIKRWNK